MMLAGFVMRLLAFNRLNVINAYIKRSIVTERHVCNDYIRIPFYFDFIMPRPSAAPGSPKKVGQQKTSYHHGDLRRALLDSALHVIETQGLAALSMRELAKQAGVSPAAPFRHFESRTALLTALAEEAMDQFVESIDESLKAAAKEGPLMQFRAIGVGFLRWALGHPTHFHVISSRRLIDFDRATLRQRNDRIRESMNNLMQAASAQGLIRPGDVNRYVIGARALVYGIARMYLDGQFPSWELNEKSALEEATAVLDQHLAAISFENSAGVVPGGRNERN